MEKINLAEGLMAQMMEEEAWKALSGSFGFTLQMLEKYQDRLDWKKVSLNTTIVWSIDPETFFANMIGVTKDINDKAQIVRCWAKPEHVPYIITKPLHSSQFVVQRNEDGSAIFQMEVVLNFELEKDLLGFGDAVHVLSPKSLVESISSRLKEASERYR
mgnify:CR=1 FL=1